MKYLIYILLIAINIPFVQTFDPSIAAIGIITGIMIATAMDEGGK